MIEVFLTVITDQLEVFLFVWFHYYRGEGYVLEALWLAGVRDHSDGGLAQLLPYILMVRLASPLHEFARLLTGLEVRQQFARSHRQAGDRKVIAVTVEVVKVEVCYVFLLGKPV